MKGFKMARFRTVDDTGSSTIHDNKQVKIDKIFYGVPLELVFLWTLEYKNAMQHLVFPVGRYGLS